MKIAVITGASSGLGIEFLRAAVTLCPEIDTYWPVSYTHLHAADALREPCGALSVRRGNGSLRRNFIPRGSRVESNNSFRPTCTGLYTAQLLPTEVLTYSYILQAVDRKSTRLNSSHRL